MKPDFGDFYKFIVSLGLALITISVAGSWFYVKENSYFLVSQSELDGLPVESRQAFEDRRSILDNASFVVFPLAAMLIFIGIIVTYFGIKVWSEKQKELDELQSLQLKRLRAGSRDATVSEQLNEEATTDFEKDMGGPMVTKPSSPQDTLPNAATAENETQKLNLARRQGLEIEIEVGYMLKRCLGYSHDVKINQILRGVSVDYILQAKDAKFPDYLVDLKIYRTELAAVSSLASIERLRMSAQQYALDTDSRVRLVVIFLRIGEPKTHIASDTLIDAINKGAGAALSTYAVFTSYDELKKKPCQWFRDVFYRESGYLVES